MGLSDKLKFGHKDERAGHQSVFDIGYPYP